MKKFILLSSLFVISCAVFAQTLSIDSLNYIINGSPITINTQQKVFKIVHIGDSHIQGDMFSGALRNNLQKQFGNAGVGLVFPYKQIYSNTPTGFTTQSNTHFGASKIARCKTNCNVGIAAYDAHMQPRDGFTVSLKNDTGLQYISAIYQTNQTQLPITINNDNNLQNYNQQDANGFTISSYTSQVASPFRVSSNQTTILNGLVVSNGNYGVLYYVIGANGATFNNYNNSLLFFEQLKTLQPDLIIVSLGTNESVSDITPEVFLQQVDSFNLRLTDACGQAQLIYTTPADNYLRKAITIKKKVKGKWRKKRVIRYEHNAKAMELRIALVNYCNNNQIMAWDLFSVMGGKHSMKTWVNNGYAAKDHIHFNKVGYELQGKLLFEALLRNIKTQQ